MDVTFHLEFKPSVPTGGCSTDGGYYCAVTSPCTHGSGFLPDPRYHEHCFHFMYRILELNGGTPPLTYKRFLRILSLLGDPEVPVRNPTAEDFQ